MKAIGSDPTFAASCREDGEFAAAATVTDPETGEETELPIEDGTVTLDATSAVRGRLELTVADETGLLTPTLPTDALAPYGNEIKAWRGFEYPDGSRLMAPLGVYGIQDTHVSDDGLITLSGLDRGQRIANARFEAVYAIAAGLNYGAQLLAMLLAVYPSMPYRFTATTVLTPLLVFDEGADRWETALEKAEGIGMDLYFDGDGECVLEPFAPGEPVAEIAEGEGGVLLEAQRDWTREGSYNAVIASGENASTGALYKGRAYDLAAGSPTHYGGKFAPVPFFYYSEFFTSTAQAQDAAEAILARELGTTEQVSFGSIPNPALEPGDKVRVRRAAMDIDQDLLIESITIPLNNQDPMTATTKAVLVS